MFLVNVSCISEYFTNFISFYKNVLANDVGIKHQYYQSSRNIFSLNILRTTPLNWTKTFFSLVYSFLKCHPFSLDHYNRFHLLNPIKIDLLLVLLSKKSTNFSLPKTFFQPRSKDVEKSDNKFCLGIFICLLKILIH